LKSLSTHTPYCQESPTQLAYRPDIDGLRALAVLFVLFFHAFPNWVSGGFIGVDIFFVISGFLISTIIFDGLDDGTFRFITFYSRRIRRIFPALIIILIVCAVFGWITLIPDEYEQFGKHIAGSAAFIPNIILWMESGYFDKAAGSKPLLHLWSLGIEEQFYLIWPFILWGMRGRRLTIFIIILSIIAASFLACVIGRHDFPVSHFYFPQSRFWELMIGAALAAITLYKKYIFSAAIERIEIFGGGQSKIKNLQSFVGGSMIVYAAFNITSSYIYPGFWALLPTIGTYLLIAAGPEAWINRVILANKGLVWIGLISYPLYLWHWPLLSFAYIIKGSRPSYIIRATLLLTSTLLAWGTYRLVEKPIRFGNYSKTKVIILLALMMATGGFGFWISLEGAPNRFPEEIRTLLSRTYESAENPKSSLGASNDPKGPLLVTWGDSHSRHLAAGLAQLQQDRSFRFTNFRWDYCSPESRPFDQCTYPSPVAMDKIRQLKPDIVILSAFWFQYKNREQFIRDSVRFLQQIHVRKIILLGPAPFWSDPPRLLLYKAYKNDPEHHLPDRLSDENPGDAAVEKEASDLAKQLGLVYLSARDFLCNEQGCLARIGDSLIQGDLTHYTPTGSILIMRHFAPAIFDGTNN